MSKRLPENGIGMKVSSWRYAGLLLLLLLSVLALVVPFQLRLDDPAASILLISGLILYLSTTNGLLYQLWRAPVPATTGVRLARIASILVLGAPSLVLLGGYLVTMRDVEVMGAPIVAMPFALTAPLWFLALRRSIRQSPAALSEIF